MGVKLVALAGSLRAGSFNKMAVRLAAEGARAAGAEVASVDLRDFPMPIYDEEIERAKGVPETARELKELFIGSHGLIIASPEYNGSVTAVLKNTLDWISRPTKRPDGAAEPPHHAFAGKVVGLLAASPGALGGLRGLVHARAIMANLSAIVLPEQVAVQKAHEAFNPDGTIKDDKVGAALKNLGVRVAHVAGKLSA